ncbi:MAG: hypothetical protein IJ300_06965 [Clostridia bacterium]|nr:hypothetical protein [Clostridia bacterium]
MDIYFYDLDFNLIHILPNSSIDIGYISANTQIDFAGDGKFEILYHDEELRLLIKQYPDGMIIKWGKFEGILTDWQTQRKDRRIFGTHLNGVLHKEVIPTQAETTETVDVIAKRIITEYYPWLTWKEQSYGEFESITFGTDTYKYGNEVFKELCSLGKCGYRIYVEDKTLCFGLLPIVKNPLILSEGNRNAYEFQEDFDNKTSGCSGWYQNEESVWTYIEGEKTGLKGQTVILSSKTAEAAAEELKNKTVTYNTQCKTRNIEYAEDYILGDSVRVDTDGMVSRKIITNVKLWHEGASYHEEPVLSNEGDELV